MEITSKHDELNSEQLNCLKKYKYRSVDKSYLTKYVLGPYYEACTKIFPKWIAPNLITVVGVSFVAFNFLSVVWICPTLDCNLSSRMYISFALCLWIYATMDNVDGKQARRTGSSSPLGDLFDHGLDSFICTMQGIVVAATIKTGYGWRLFLACLVGPLAFFPASWEHYHTGVFYLGYINGPTEGLLLVVLIHVVAAYYGSDVYLRPLSSLPFASSIPFPSRFMNNPAFDVATFCSPVLLGVCSFMTSIYNVYAHCKHTKTPFLSKLLDFIPFILIYGSAVAWFTSPFSLVQTRYTLIFMILIGITFGRYIMKVIVRRLTGGPFPLFSMSFVPLLLGAFFANLPRFLPLSGGQTPIFNDYQELMFLVFSITYVLIIYVYWATYNIRTISVFLGIRCFKISPKIEPAINGLEKNVKRSTVEKLDTNSKVLEKENTEKKSKKILQSQSRSMSRRTSEQ